MATLDTLHHDNNSPSLLRVLDSGRIHFIIVEPAQSLHMSMHTIAQESGTAGIMGEIL